MRRTPTAARRAAFLAFVALGPGCAPQPGVPQGGSPVVAPDSAEARKAIQERDEMIRLREAQEAKARRRNPVTAEAG